MIDNKSCDINDRYFLRREFFEKELFWKNAR